MAEEGLGTGAGPSLPGLPALLSNRNILIAVAAGGLVFLLIVLLVFGRGCFGGGGPGQSGNYTIILSHLGAKEIAEVANELKTNLKIPYKLMEDGSAVAVPKDKADDARIGLASKGLPQGGVVGFEIFDKGGLGTTDFDRRIKFIRAISGELSRNISRMSGVEEARVQIVVPETQIFVPQKAPVTASVLLRLRKGTALNQEQIEGIIRLVCGSVENLKPENVTVVDINGYILSKPKTVAKVAQAQQEARQLIDQETENQLVADENGQETILKNQKVTPLGEQAFDQLKYKENLEENLRQKAQAILDVYYLPDKARVWVNAELSSQVPAAQPPAQGETAQTAVQPQQLPWKLAKLSVVILVDDKDPLARQAEMTFNDLKKTTFEAVAGAVSYEAARGDRIELKRVPFGEVQKPPAGATNPQPINTATRKPVAVSQGTVKALIGFFSQPLVWAVALGLIILVAGLRFFRRSGKPARSPEIDLRKGPGRSAAAAQSQWDKQPAVVKMRQVAETNPEKFAEILKDWFKEGGAES